MPEPTTIAVAIEKIAPLLTSLIERVKDGKTAALVQQVQSLNQTIQAGYFAAEQKATALASENFDQKRAHAQAIDNLNAAHREKVTALEKEIAALNERHAAEVAKFQKPQAPAEPELSKEELYIIGLMASRGGKTTLEAMASGLQCPLTRAKYYADNLKRLELIRIEALIPDGPMLYALRTAGRAFAVRKGLI